MKSFHQIQEAAYVGNLGFSEMVAFYKKANKDEEKQMDVAVKKNDYSLFKQLIKKVLGVTLKWKRSNYFWKLVKLSSILN